MAIYFDHNVQIPVSSKAPGVSHHLVRWHSTHPILAVSSKTEATNTDGSVNFFLAEGEQMENSSICRSVVAECMEWHPEDKVIAIGWQSGEITTYDVSENQIYEQSSIHRSLLTVINWNQCGSRLVSGDQSGLLIVWKVDSLKLHPIPLHQHRLHSTITHCTMLHPIAMARDSLEMGRAKGGSVLDAFSWQNKSAISMAKSVVDPICCFCVNGDGALFFLDNCGDCVERLRMDGSVLAILLNYNTRILSIITHEMVISQFAVTHDGHLNISTSHAKLSGRKKVESIITVANKILATCSHENVIRFWDFENSDNFVLDMQRFSRLHDGEEVVTAIAYNSTTSVLAGGTNAGCVYLWRWTGNGQQPSSAAERDTSENWEFVTSSNLIAPTVALDWGSEKNLLSVNSGKAVQILSEHVMNTHFKQQVSAVQISSGELLVECHDVNLQLVLKSDLHIHGICTTEEHVAVWDGKKLEVYAISREKSLIRQSGSFATTASTVAMYEMSIYVIEKKQISIRTFQGTVKQVLVGMEQEGSPVTLSVDSHFLMCGTDAGRIKLWDISRREAKLLGGTNLKNSVTSNLGKIHSVHSNSNGTKISIIAQQGEGEVTLLLWFVDSDTTKTFSPYACMQGEQDQQGVASPLLPFPPNLPENSLIQQQQLVKELLGRTPISHIWDVNEPQVLVVEWTQESQEDMRPHMMRTGNGSESYRVTGSQSARFRKVEKIVAVFFVPQERCILASELLPTELSLNDLLGAKIPFLYYSKKGTGISSHPSMEESPSADQLVRPFSVGQVTLRDFVGLETSEPEVVHAMVDFSYHVMLGNLDDAFKAIKSIKSRAVWESMAKVCVKTERLDVAVMCLGNMGNARAARAVREAKKEPQPEVRLAVLAIELGMLEEAEKLYKKSERYDLLNKFYQLSGQWTRAMEVAETKDRMHLKTTYYAYAKHSEEMGEINAATTSYEKSGTHKFEVPRMLMDDPSLLENYVIKSKDKDVRKWWAEYLESCGEWEQAMQYYETARDYYSLVRVLCFNGQISRAVEIVEESGCKAAAYHLARRLSVEGQDPKRAIHFFTKAQCYSPAIQLAKENGLDHELMNLALLSTQEDMLDAARYYEENSETVDKAILLFHKGGEVSHALDLCFQHHHYEVLDQIAEDLHEGSSPEMTQRVADYFMEKGLFDKAMEMLVRTKKTEEALKLCTLHSVPLTEELVERMTVPKNDDETPEDAAYRLKVLEQLADCCLSLGSYHLAAKKYTQAGNKTKAMKALLKSGDTEKVIFFAGVSRQKDIYVMAANYLQTLDWRNDPSIMKNIIGFYTKGRALDSLAGFYDACAQVEIDEYQNYEKAAGALDEAIKVLGKVKARNPAALAAKIEFFKERVELIRKFANAKNNFPQDPGSSMQICQSLLDEPRLDTAVRAGDVYGIMIEHYSETGHFEQAFSLMKEMKQRIPNVNVTFYIDLRIVEDIHTAMGIPLGRGMGAGELERVEKRNEEEEEEEEEEVESDVEGEY